MSLTSAATTELLKYSKQADYKLEMKSLVDGSGWVTVAYKSLTVKHQDGLPATLDAQLINSSYAYSDETDTGNPAMLRALARVTAYVGSESKLVFEGRVVSNSAQESMFSIRAQDYMADFNETECEVSLEPGTVRICDEATTREIQEIDPVNQPGVYGFVYSGPGDDAFNDAGTARRSWQKRPIEVWIIDPPDNDSDNQINSTKFDVDWSSGVIQFLIPDGDLQASYYVTDVTCYLESTASGATNCDFARVFDSMATYDKFKGGPGFELGTHYGNSINQVNTGSKTFRISGDWRADYPDNCQICVQGSTGNDGTYTVNGTPSYSGGNTTITVDQSIASSTADGVLSRDVGLDLDRAFYFKGKCSDLLAKFEKYQQNLKVWYHADTARFRFRAVEQLGTPTWTLVAPRSIPQSRDTQDWYTRIVRTGKAGLPINEVHIGGVDGTLTDITTGTATWARFTEQVAGADDTFANVKKYLYDGDSNKGAIAHNLDPAPDVDDPGAGAGENRRYKGWYYLVKLDLGAIKNIERVRVHLPGTRNQKASAGHQGRFWPGVWLQISDNDTDWFTLSVDAYGRYSPETVLDFEADRMERPTGRYVRVLSGAYKQGLDNDSDPAIGLGELEIYTSLGYTVERAIAPLHSIVAVNSGLGLLQIDGDRRDGFAIGDSIEIIESTGNDGTYTLTDVVYGAGKTALEVASLPDNTADGYVYTNEPYAYLDGTTVSRVYVDLWRRTGSRWRTSREDFGQQYSGAVAADIALQTLEESLRLFAEVKYESICDPRVEVWDTVLAEDDRNGDVEFLVQDLTLTASETSLATTISGVNYGAGALGT